MTDEFDEWLEGELKARYTQLVPTRPTSPARYLGAAERRWSPMTPLSKLSAVLGAKALTGLAVVTVAAAGVGAKAAATGNPNPLNWGEQVSDQVQKCKAELPKGEHGIGECVSDFANQKPDKDKTSSESEGRSDSHPTPGAEGRSDSHPTLGTEGRSDSHPNHGTEGRSDSHPTPNEGRSDSHPTPRAGH